MALTVTHAFTSNIADDPKAAAAGEVLPSHWNAPHIVTGATERTVLSANTIYYVSTTGSDSNGGTAPSTDAWATFQHASSFISQNIDYNGFNITIQFADGSYVGGIIGPMFNYVPNLVNGTLFFAIPQLAIAGNVADANAVKFTDSAAEPGVIVDCDAVGQGVYVLFKNIRFDNPSSALGGGGLFIENSTVAIGDSLGSTVVFAGNNLATSGDAVVSGINSLLVLSDNITISGAWDFGPRAVDGGIIKFGWDNTSVWTFAAGSGITFFCEAKELGICQFDDFSYSGSIGTNQIKFRARQGGFINVAPLNGDLNTLPGNKPGIVNTGGRYTYLNGELSGASFGGLTVSNLTSLITPQGIGERNFVTDSNSSLSAGLGNVVAASTSTSTSSQTPVYWDGANWRIG